MVRGRNLVCLLSSSASSESYSQSRPDPIQAAASNSSTTYPSHTIQLKAPSNPNTTYIAPKLEDNNTILEPKTLNDIPPSLTDPQVKHKRNCPTSKKNQKERELMVISSRAVPTLWIEHRIPALQVRCLTTWPCWRVVRCIGESARAIMTPSSQLGTLPPQAGHRVRPHFNACVHTEKQVFLFLTSQFPGFRSALTSHCYLDCWIPNRILETTWTKYFTSEFHHARSSFRFNIPRAYLGQKIGKTPISSSSTPKSFPRMTHAGSRGSEGKRGRM
ncbi:uncharacterized protein BDZ83DRAFT_428578 [Colletotrichum acutatum]|uniref:Uncharacterized protein n=1 Tax=Glomerella acutata TaxID=27357 RepID=A0AAD8UG14_GLOAC|nr:uncharacterized protein BDZ83DRAFT_428578 [Colletotrichum acutatum]KAK1722403.1 hypothetical protein BDZ83DRAFT_428578 [Colletotrichum acutatum]